MALETIVHIYDDTFETEVIKAEKSVIVDFYATWCPPCKALAPVYEEVSKEYGEKVKFVKMNVEGSKKAVEYRVWSIPTLIMFTKEKEVVRKTGYMDKANLKLLIEYGLKEASKK